MTLDVASGAISISDAIDEADDSLATLDALLLLELSLEMLSVDDAVDEAELEDKKLFFSADFLSKGCSTNCDNANCANSRWPLAVKCTPSFARTMTFPREGISINLLKVLPSVVKLFAVGT